jgi:hypothetical protein
MFRARRVLQEFETHLALVDKTVGRNARGKSEWKRYGDESRRLKISLHGLEMADGTVLELTVEGRKIGDMVVQQGRARFERESEKGEFVPSVGAGNLLQVLLKGTVIAEGAYVAE